jgi:hypothetical protein
LRLDTAFGCISIDTTIRSDNRRQTIFQNDTFYPPAVQRCAMSIMIQQQLDSAQTICQHFWLRCVDSLKAAPIAPSFWLVMAWRASVHRARLPQQLDFRLLVTSSLLFFPSSWAGAIRPSPPSGYPSLRDPFIYGSASLQSRGLLDCSCFA